MSTLRSSFSSNSRRFTLLLLCIFGATLSHAEPLAPPDLKALLGRIRDKRAAAPQLQADFQETKEVHLLKKPLSSSGKVWFQAPNKFRREVKGSSPSVTVSDGQQLWIYYPGFKSAEHYSLGKRSPLDAAIAAITASMNLEHVDDLYHITGTREANAFVLQLVPRNPSMKRFLQSFTIRMNGELQVERTDMLQPNGDRIVTAYANENRAAVPAGTFDFTPPPGTDVTTPLGH